MDADQYKRVKAIYLQALELPTGERLAFVDAQTDSVDDRREALSLLEQAAGPIIDSESDRPAVTANLASDRRDSGDSGDTFD